MYQLKSNRVEDNKEVVHFSDNQTFYYQGILFKVFKTGSKNPKAPTLALLKVDTDSRVSGLFKIGSNLYQGDTKSEKGKVYFRLKFLERNTIELTNFNTALIQGGFITPEAEIKLEQVSKKYIPLLDKAIDEGYAQLAKNRNKRVFRALDKIGVKVEKIHSDN